MNVWGVVREKSIKGARARAREGGRRSERESTRAISRSRARAKGRTRVREANAGERGAGWKWRVHSLPKMQPTPPTMSNSSLGPTHLVNPKIHIAAISAGSSAKRFGPSAIAVAQAWSCSTTFSASLRLVERIDSKGGCVDPCAGVGHPIDRGEPPLKTRVFPAVPCSAETIDGRSGAEQCDTRVLKVVCARTLLAWLWFCGKWARSVKLIMMMGI
jgi:hypothetical protein